VYRSVAPTTSPNFDSAAKHEGELTLLNLTNKAQDVLQIARLYTVFDFMADEPAAVKSYGQSAAATVYQSFDAILIFQASSVNGADNPPSLRCPRLMVDGRVSKQMALDCNPRSPGG